MMVISRFVAAVLVALWAAPSLAIVADIETSKASGVAPLAVFFDARGTTESGMSDAETFLDLSYSWDFGDTACENSKDVWVNSGKPKCNDLGPLAGHVYESPGTYQVTLNVERRGQLVSSEQVYITVQDPNSVYSGQRTVCVSRSGDFSDPNGVCDDAEKLTSTGGFTNILAAQLGAGRRVLFRRGETWNVGGEYTYSAGGPATIGAFGVGAKPRVTAGGGKIFTFGGGNAGLRVMDIDFRGSDNATSGHVAFTNSQGQAKDALFLRVDARDFATTYLMAVHGGPQPGTSYMNNGVAIVDSTSISRTGGNGNNDFYGGGERLLFLGNDFGDADGTEHTLRFHYVGGAVISHNRLGRNTPDKKHNIKMHNIFGGNPCTQHVMIADNRIDSGGAANSVDLGPRDEQSPDDCVRYVRVERNHVKMGGSTGYRQILLRGSDNLVANNVLDLSNADSRVRPQGVMVGKRMSTQKQACTSNRVFNNTCYMSNAAPGAICVRTMGSSSNTTVRNNLLYAPRISSADAQAFRNEGASVAASDNVAVGSNPFVSTNLGAPGNFALDSGASGAIDQGTQPSSNLRYDFTGENSREVGPVDIGAFEYDGSGSGRPAAPVLFP